MSLLKSKSDEGRDVLREGGPEGAHPLVDVRWLLIAGGLTLAAVVVLAYAAFCFMFYQGQWQMVLHPAPMQQFPAKDMPPHEDVHFAVTEGGQPTMFGWWIPADKEARMESDVLVYFPGGSGSLSARTDRIAFWHQQRINVFAFDYRGFGNSEKMRPSQESMQQDAASVARYLTDTRHIPASRMVFYGEGIGCFTAILAANQTPGLGAVILNNPVMSQLGVFEADERTHLVPLHLLSRDMFSLSPGIEQLRAPTMVMTTVGTQQNEDDAKQVLAALHTRKSMLNIPSEGNLLKLTQSVNAFLDATVGSATPTNQGTGPAPAPSPGK